MILLWKQSLMSVNCVSKERISYREKEVIAFCSCFCVFYKRSYKENLEVIDIHPIVLCFQDQSQILSVLFVTS